MSFFKNKKEKLTLIVDKWIVMHKIRNTMHAAMHKKMEYFINQREG